MCISADMDGDSNPNMDQDKQTGFELTGNTVWFDFRSRDKTKESKSHKTSKQELVADPFIFD